MIEYINTVRDEYQDDWAALDDDLKAAVCAETIVEGEGDLPSYAARFWAALPAESKNKALAAAYKSAQEPVDLDADY